MKKTIKMQFIFIFLFSCVSVEDDTFKNTNQREMTPLELTMHKKDLEEMAEKNTTELGRGLTKEEQDLVFKENGHEQRSPTAEEDAITAEYFLPPTANVELLDIKCPDNICTYTIKITNILNQAGTGHIVYSLDSPNESFRLTFEKTPIIEPGHYEIVESNSNEKPVSSITIDAYILPVDQSSGVKIYRGGTTPSVHKVYITENERFREPTID